MNILPINNNHNRIQPNFKGFSNVIYDVCPYKDLRPSFSYISMHLDNINGKDLDIWHSIQKKFLHKDQPKDVITFSVFNDFDGKRHFLLNNLILKLTPENENTKFGKFVLKTYSFIASLTKRIEMRNPVVYDKNFNNTLFETVDNITTIFDDNSEFANKYVQNSIDPNLSPFIPAKIINEMIQEEMENYFLG